MTQPAIVVLDSGGGTVKAGTSAVAEPRQEPACGSSCAQVCWHLIAPPALPPTATGCALLQGVP